MLDESDCRLGGQCFLPGCISVLPLAAGVAGCVMRSVIRERYGMEKETFVTRVMDFLIHHLPFTANCAIIQV